MIKKDLLIALIVARRPGNPQTRPTVQQYRANRRYRCQHMTAAQTRGPAKGSSRGALPDSTYRRARIGCSEPSQEMMLAAAARAHLPRCEDHHTIGAARPAQTVLARASPACTITFCAQQQQT